MRYEEAEARNKETEERFKKTSKPLPEFEALEKQKQALDEKLEDSLKEIASRDEQIEKLMADFTKQTEELENMQKALSTANTNGASHAEESSTVGMLKAELASLRDQLNRATALNGGAKQSMSAQGRGEPPVFNTTLGKGYENGTTPNMGVHATPGKRKNRRGSVSQIYPSDSTQSTLPAYDEFQPKAFSMANYPQDALRKMVDAEMDPEAIAEEIIQLLEEEKPLDEDVLGSIITNLKVPQPSSTNPPSAKEVLFPAHLISLITNEMWKYGMLRESERFLANVMQTIQQHVMVSLLPRLLVQYAM